MPVMGETRDLGVEAMTAVCTWLGLYTAEAATTTWTGAVGSVLKKGAAHGYATGDLVYVKACTEGGTGSMFIKGEFLYVKEKSSTEIELSQTETFNKETWTVEIKGTVELERMKEVTGAPYKRIKAKWEAKAAAPNKKPGYQEDPNKWEVPCANPTKVDAVSMHTAETAGGLRKIEKLAVSETVLEAKAFGINQSVMDLLTAGLTTP